MNRFTLIKMVSPIVLGGLIMSLVVFSGMLEKEAFGGGLILWAGALCVIGGISSFFVLFVEWFNKREKEIDNETN